MDEGARFPRVGRKAGHYESFYIKACEPGGGRGIWIRHTVHKRPGAEPNASIWFVLFDRDAEAPRATKVTVLVRLKGSKSYRTFKTVATNGAGYWGLNTSTRGQLWRVRWVSPTGVKYEGPPIAG